MQRVVLFVLVFIGVFGAYLTYTQYNPTPHQARILDKNTFSDTFHDIEVNDQLTYRWLFRPLTLPIPLVTTQYRVIHIVSTAVENENPVEFTISGSKSISVPIQGQGFRTYQILLPDDSATRLQQSSIYLSITPQNFEQIENRRIGLAINSITIEPVQPSPMPPMWVLLVVFGMLSIVFVFAKVLPPAIEHSFWLIVVIGIYTLTVVQIINTSMAATAIVSMATLYIIYRYGSPIYAQLTSALPAIPEPEYRSDIDGLRALAVIAVVIYHAFPEVLPGGFIGVDIFFVISGYLITHIIIKDIHAQRFSIRHFYVRRIRRIFPALIVVLLFTASIGKILLYPYEYSSLGTHILAGAGFVSNIIFYQQVNYFSDISINQPLLHLWSLGVEEQFYILWPIILWFATKRPRLLIPTLIFLLVTSFLIYTHTVTDDPSAAFFLILSRFWQLGIGGFIAIYAMISPASVSHQPHHKSLFISAAGVLLYAYSIFFLNESEEYAVWNTVIPTISGVLLVYPNAKNWVSNRCLSHPLFVWMGKISFPLYLWHWPLLSFAFMSLVGEFTPFLKILTIGLSIVFAAITTVYIEKPVRFSQVKRVPTSWLLASMCVVVGVGLSIQTRQITPLLPNWERLRVTRMVPLEDCTNLFGFTTERALCTIQVGPTTQSEYVIIGDSHAIVLARGMLATTSNHITMFTQPGCAPLLPTTCGDDTAQSMQDVSRYLRNHPTQHTHRYVILAGRYAQYAYRNRTSNTFEVRLRNTFVAFSDLPRTTTIFVHQVPELSYAPQNCARLNTLLEPSNPLPTLSGCNIATSAVDQYFQPYQLAVQKLLVDFPNIQEFTANQLFCDQQTCIAFIDNQIAYQDQDHLNTWGGLRVAQLFVAQFP